MTLEDPGYPPKRCSGCVQLEAALTTERQARAHVEQERDNFRTALHWSQDRHYAIGLDLAGEQSLRRKADAALLASERAREAERACSLFWAEKCGIAIDALDAAEAEVGFIQDQLTAATRTGAQPREQIEALVAKWLREASDVIGDFEVTSGVLSGCANELAALVLPVRPDHAK